MASKPNKQVECAMGTAPPEFNMISSEDVEGTAVYDPNGNEIGEVDHLMIDKISGQVRYAIMSFGGFLGLGHWDATGTRRTSRNSNSGTRRNSVTIAGWETRMHRHYNVQPYWNDPGRRDLSQGASSTSQSM
jgi:hypothetical protein